MARRAAAKSMDVVSKKWEAKTARPVGTLCTVCHEAQRRSPSGTTCVNGHGGVDGYEPVHQRECPVPHGASADCAPPGWCAIVDAARRAGRGPAQLASELAAAFPSLFSSKDIAGAERELGECCPQQRSTSAGNPKVRFVALPTTPLVQIDTDGTGEVAGAIVKLCPTLRASERVSFDGPGLVKSLRDRGALAVQLAPRILPDDAKRAEEATPPRQTTREAVEDWFSRLVGCDEADKQAALELVLRAVEEDERNHARED